MGFARPFIGKQKYNCAIDYIIVKMKHAILGFMKFWIKLDQMDQNIYEIFIFKMNQNGSNHIRSCTITLIMHQKNYNQKCRKIFIFFF
jgi:hypothetical protein